MFSTIDLKSGYWQILLDQPSKHLTTFTIPDRATYQYRVIPFGLKNAPATFQKLLTRVLTGYLGNFVHVHLDDIIIFFQSPEHLGHLRLMYERLHEYGLRCTTEKCRFGVSTILTWARDREELQQAPTAYVPRFAEIAAPITGLLNAKSKFCWTAEAQTTFEQLKQKMSRLLQLHRPDFPKKFTLQTDASGIGMTAVLYQVDHGQRLVSYGNAKQNKAQQKYHVNEQECLAIVWAIQRFRAYSEDSEFTLRTDNKALLLLNTAKNSNDTLTRCHCCRDSNSG